MDGESLVCPRVYFRVSFMGIPLSLAARESIQGAEQRGARGESHPKLFRMREV